MEDGESKTSELNKYFNSDPPSVFDNIQKGDKITTKKEEKMKTTHDTKRDSVILSKNPLISSATMNPVFNNNFTGRFMPTDYTTAAINGDIDCDKVPENVINMWKIPSTEYQRDGTPLLTKPGMCSPNEMQDVIADAVVKHLGKSELIYRKILTADDVSQDETGLHSLISKGCFRAAVNLTARLLGMLGQGYGHVGQPTTHTPYSLQLWFTRLALLAKLGEFELLQAEAEPFGQLNRPDVHFEFFGKTFPDKKGSMASFSFRLLLAELPIFLGYPQTALDRLSGLYIISNEIRQFYAKTGTDSLAVKFWQKREMRLLHSIINCGIIMKKFSMVDDIICNMITEYDLSREQRRALYSAWGRIYLQVGDIFGAEQKFAEARRLREMNPTPDFRDLVDKGLATVSQNDFQEAYVIFQKALHLEPGNTMVLNNMGVCLLYAGKLQDSINLYERAIGLNPQETLNESLLINLSTLYELESNDSKNKKFNLLRLLNKYKADLNISLDICLKLQLPN